MLNKPKDATIVQPRVGTSLETSFLPNVETQYLDHEMKEMFPLEFMNVIPNKMVWNIENNIDNSETPIEGDFSVTATVIDEYLTSTTTNISLSNEDNNVHAILGNLYTTL
ncbi:uncharacterized protein LOC136076947 [Hydra vulgaris]|uniref:Uncharacterized protein LOC136076947 n=1 Tax=Hydra vulgaris TaxID=6087 RepID=A0ABM4BDI6_HYDVU